MLYIIQNDPEVPPGNIAKNLTVPHTLLHPYNGEQLPPVDEISALIVLGGAMSANDDLIHRYLADVKLLIRRVVAMNIPFLGICLGGQLLAAALGANVVSGRWEELGTLTVELTAEGKADLLFRGVGEQFTTLQWHHDSFDIPAGGVLLASSADCPHQAFRVGENAWGLQFHPEVNEKIVREWSASDNSCAGRTDECLTAFRAESESYDATARQLLYNFSQRMIYQP